MFETFVIDHDSGEMDWLGSAESLEDATALVDTQVENAMLKSGQSAIVVPVVYRRVQR